LVVLHAAAAMVRVAANAVHVEGLDVTWSWGDLRARVPAT